MITLEQLENLCLTVTRIFLHRSVCYFLIVPFLNDFSIILANTYSSYLLKLYRVQRKCVRSAACPHRNTILQNFSEFILVIILVTYSVTHIYFTRQSKYLLLALCFSNAAKCSCRYKAGYWSMYWESNICIIFHLCLFQNMSKHVEQALVISH